MQQQQTWWAEIELARRRIDELEAVLGNSSFESSRESLHSSEKPARDLLFDPEVSSIIKQRLASKNAGQGGDELCKWLYDTYLTGDTELQNVVLGFVPCICSAYLPRVSSGKPGEQALAGFEAVLLALYTLEYKSRQGRPILVNIPTLSQPSLYHTPRVPTSSGDSKTGQLSPPLEPQEAVKTTKRAAIVGIALELYHRKIASMPESSKLEFCEAARSWAMRGCSWAERVDEISKLALLQPIAPGPDPTLTGSLVTVGPSSSTSIFVPGSQLPENENGGEEPVSRRIHLPVELVQPILRILGHCLMGPGNSEELKDAAVSAAQALYARATHELVPGLIIPTRALLRLDEAARLAASTAVVVSTPTKSKKPEILLTPQ